jgi:hypothetical protein
MHSNMALRIHEYSLAPDFAAELWYYRDAAWHDLTERVLVANSSGNPFPITKTMGYRQPYSCSLTLNNEDGLLTPENTASAYNKNAALAYDALLDEGRKMRLKWGINCYGSLTGSASVSGTAATAGTLPQLVDALYADAEDEDDGEWVHWSAVAANAEIVLTVDLGSAQTVRHGMISFLSMTNASPQIMLPSSVKFEYSTDNAIWYDCAGEIFKMRPGDLVTEADAEYNDSRTGQNFLAWFTDLSKSARYLRITITNIAEENEIYLDEIGVWGGDTKTAQLVNGFTGYLGDSIDAYSSDGRIELQFQDVRKKEGDNRLLELTRMYKDERPEQIIFDLLTNVAYWSFGEASDDSVVLNGGFESGLDNWEGDGETVIWSETAHSGARSARLPPFSGSMWIQQGSIPIVAGTDYRIAWWAKSTLWPGGKFHLHIIPDVGDWGRYPASGNVQPGESWHYFQCGFTAPEGATTCTLWFDKGEGWCQLWFDDVEMVPLNAISEGGSYGASVDISEIGWTADENLSGFEIPKWQGQNATILDYCKELAALIGWVYDADGDGVRQFYEPEFNRLTASEYLNYWGYRQCGGPTRHKTGIEIRNIITVVGAEKGGKEISRPYRHEGSIAKYGPRTGKVTQPLIKNGTLCDQLGKALLRDFAYCRDALTAKVWGSFDIERPKSIVAFHEPVRAFLDKDSLWSIESVSQEMCVAGEGSFRSEIECRQFVSTCPGSPANIACTGAANSIIVAWDANAECDIDGYYVYYSETADGVFARSGKTSGAGAEITGLADDTPYWICVTAANVAGTESEKSALVKCLAGVGNSGTEATTWGIADFDSDLADDDPTVSLDFHWTPDIDCTPDYIIVSICGPSDVDPATNKTEYTRMEISNGVLAHVFSRHAKLDFMPGVTKYWRLAIHEVVVGDVHYKFGSPLYSNSTSETWPV